MPAAVVFRGSCRMRWRCGGRLEFVRMVVFSECISHLHGTWEYSHISVLEYAEVPLYAPFEINGFVHSLTWENSHVSQILATSKQCIRRIWLF